MSESFSSQNSNALIFNSELQIQLELESKWTLSKCNYNFDLLTRVHIVALDQIDWKYLGYKKSASGYCTYSSWRVQAWGDAKRRPSLEGASNICNMIVAVTQFMLRSRSYYGPVINRQRMFCTSTAYYGAFLDIIITLSKFQLPEKILKIWALFRLSIQNLLT